MKLRIRNRKQSAACRSAKPRQSARDNYDRRRRSKRIWASALCIVVGIQLSTCAVTDVHHLATTNYVDRKITPDNRVAQWALTPVYIPIAAVTLTVDNFIIAPIVHLPSALLDTWDFLTGDVEGYYANMGTVPFRIVLLPVVFAGDWMGRTWFALDTREDGWNWPAWGRQWRRDSQGRLIDPPEEQVQ